MPWLSGEQVGKLALCTGQPALYACLVESIFPQVTVASGVSYCELSSTPLFSAGDAMEIKTFVLLSTFIKINEQVRYQNEEERTPKLFERGKEAFTSGTFIFFKTNRSH